MTELVRYDAMCRAIDNAYAVDEVKDIRDKALAFEAYARQAKNTEAERRACEIRLRAEKKAGTLLAGMDRAQGKRTDISTSPQPGAKSFCEQAEESGVSKRQAERWQQLAAVPDDEFEAALAEPEKPSTASIINGAKPAQEPMNPNALWLWGRLRDFERMKLLDAASRDVVAAMTDAMRADVHRLLPPIIEWLMEATDGND